MIPTDQSISWHGLNFLIADDDVYSHLLLERAFLRTGVKIHHAYNGIEALKILLEQDIDVAIVDIIMPGYDGMEVVEKSRQHCQNTLFLAYTADILRVNKAVCLQKGFDACYTKPMLPYRLMSEIDKLVAVRKVL
ncbi:MAG: response regulator [Bacteroidales bacterium]|nr:response regulator [Bacteroidales bacterium]MBN2819416.1 response regulator [Bacteroidales bacterium]